MAIDCVQDHRVFIYDRGGRNKLKEITQVASVGYNRIRDDTSQSAISIGARSCSLQSDFLSSIEPERHEIVLFRGEDRAWEGPITRCAYTKTGMTIAASDITHYLYRTVMRSGYSNAYPNTTEVTSRIDGIIRAEFGRKEAAVLAVGQPGYGVLEYLSTLHFPGEAGTAAVTAAFQTTVWEHLDDLAAKSGIDYVVIGRQLIIWDTSHSLGQTPKMSENDFLGDLVVTAYGNDLVTDSIATDGQGNYGEYSPFANGVDPYYGLVEKLNTAYDETSGDAPPTVAELQSQAQRNYDGNNPVPVTVRVPDDSQINMAGTWEYKHLVPGVYVPLVATLPARTFSQMQKIKEIKFAEDSTGEKITMTMAPASSPDDADLDS